MSLQIRGDDVIITGTNNEMMAKFIENGAVELYHNNTKTFETTSGGSGVVGNLFLSGEFNMTTGGNKNRFIDCSVDEGEALYIRTTNGGDANHEYMASFIRGGAVELYHNEVKSLRLILRELQLLDEHILPAQYYKELQLVVKQMVMKQLLLIQVEMLVSL